MGLARGWSAWLDVYTEHQRKRQLLAAAGARLRRPKVVASFMHWLRDWEAEMLAKKSMTLEQRRAAVEAERAAETAELREINQTLQAELAQARKAMLEGSGREEEMKRLAELELEKEREKRVQHLQQLGVRRLVNMGLARGWSAWADAYYGQQRKKQLLAAAGNRLRRPKLVASFVHWHNDWETDVTAKQMLTLEQRQKAELQERTQMEAEMAQEMQKLRAELAAARKAMLEGSGREA
jgi:phospholipase/lecithinase/hemolysin